MKKFILYFVFITAAVPTLAKRDCSAIAESYIVDAGETKPAIFMGKTIENELTYQVRAIEKNTQTIFEIFLTENCEYIHHQPIAKENLD